MKFISMNINYERIRQLDLKGTKSLKKAFDNKRSRLLETFVFMTASGLNERQCCFKCGIDYKTFRYYIQRYGQHVKDQLNKARALRVHQDHERTVRSARLRINRRNNTPKCT